MYFITRTQTLLLFQVVFYGTSAGAFGVAFNCDAVAEILKQKFPNVDVGTLCLVNDMMLYFLAMIWEVKYINLYIEIKVSWPGALCGRRRRLLPCRLFHEHWHMRARRGRKFQILWYALLYRRLPFKWLNSLLHQAPNPVNFPCNLVTYCTG